jgi:hypothetical protein
MMREIILKYEFVECIPYDLKDGTIYISIAFATAMHKCCCGCGNLVVTPLSPTDWQLIFDGQSISLYPSIGNWNFSCQSHYWIKHNKIKWAPQWSKKEINAGRIQDSLAKDRYFSSNMTSTVHDAIIGIRVPEESRLKDNFWRKLKNWLLAYYAANR